MNGPVVCSIVKRTDKDTRHVPCSATKATWGASAVSGCPSLLPQKMGVPFSTGIDELPIKNKLAVSVILLVIYLL